MPVCVKVVCRQCGRMLTCYQCRLATLFARPDSSLALDCPVNRFIWRHQFRLSLCRRCIVETYTQCLSKPQGLVTIAAVFNHATDGGSMGIGAVGLLFKIIQWIIKILSSRPQRHVLMQQRQNFAVEKLGHLSSQFIITKDYKRIDRYCRECSSLVYTYSDNDQCCTSVPSCPQHQLYQDL